MYPRDQLFCDKRKFKQLDVGAHVWVALSRDVGTLDYL